MKRDESMTRQLGRYMSLAMILPVSTLVGYVIGYFLDKWLGTTFLYLVFLLFGIASGMINLIRDLTKEDRGN